MHGCSSIQLSSRRLTLDCMYHAGTQTVSFYMWSASVSCALVSTNDTYGAGKRAGSDLGFGEIKFLRLTRLDGKKNDDVGRDLHVVLCKRQNGFTYRTSGQSAGRYVMKIRSVTQVIMEVHVFSDVIQSLRFFLNIGDVNMPVRQDIASGEIWLF